MEGFSKIKSLAELAKISAKLKKDGKKIVLCHGVFDLLHPGHIRHFLSAKKYGDILIVTLTGDTFVKKGPGRPIFNENLRSEVVGSISAVDYVAVVESDSATTSISKLKPDFYVKGPDYRQRKKETIIPRKLIEEEKEVNKHGGKLIFTEDDIIFSSSKLINDHFEVYPAETKKYLENFKMKYSSDYVFEKLYEISDLRILVIGDAIIDQYHYCIPMGKSSKEPLIVHQSVSTETFLGGTLATANHLAALSKHVSLVTVLGKKKSFEQYIRRGMKKEVAMKFFQRDDTNTVIKLRYIDDFSKQKLFQISFMKDGFISKELERSIMKYLGEEIKNYDLIIVNDFGHGMLTDKVIRLITAKAKYLALNVQANSANFGFNVITKYPRADYVCIDDQEIRLATHDKYSGLDKLIKKIDRKMKSRDIIVTKGPYGTISYHDRDFIYTPAFTKNVVDRVGAGDALFAITSPCIYNGMERDLVAFIGNVAGALHVQTVGNRKSIELADMVRFMTRLLK